MKAFVSIICFLFCAIICTGQGVDQSIKNVSDDLAGKLSKKNLVNIGIIDFVNGSKRRDAAMIYIQEQVELDLINADGLQVMDRNHILQLLSENKLVSQGLIEESAIKKAVSFKRIDGWVVAEITDFGDQLKLKLKVINVNTSQVLAASITTLDAVELNKIFAPKPCPYCLGSGMLQIYSKCTSCNGTGGSECWSCHGTGQDPTASALRGAAVLCGTCKAKGKINCSVCQGNGQMALNVTCRNCNGSGKKAH